MTQIVHAFEHKMHAKSSAIVAKTAAIAFRAVNVKAAAGLKAVSASLMTANVILICVELAVPINPIFKAERARMFPFNTGCVSIY